jgi:hypothetical protein
MSMRGYICRNNDIYLIIIQLQTKIYRIRKKSIRKNFVYVYVQSAFWSSYTPTLSMEKTSSLSNLVMFSSYVSFFFYLFQNLFLFVFSKLVDSIP